MKKILLLIFASIITSTTITNWIHKYTSDDLIKAIDNHNVKEVQFLISQGVDVNAPTKNGEFPIFEAVVKNDAPILYLLLEAGAQVNIQDNIYKLTPLMSAAILKHKFLIRMLLANGASPAIKDSEGYTAYDYAFKMGNQEIMSLLPRNQKSPAQ